jgi:hypothetical protein
MAAANLQIILWESVALPPSTEIIEDPIVADATADTCVDYH